MDISAFCFCIASLFRYLSFFKLQRALLRYTKVDTFLSTDGIYWLLIEIIIALIQPYPFLDGVILYTDKDWYLKKVRYELNDLFLIAVFSRIYIIYRFVISFSKFYDERADRITYILLI
jgi:hypothetical protein